MRQGFDLFTMIGWANLKSRKFWGLWAWRYAVLDTWHHLLCLAMTHTPEANYLGGETYCRRCYCKWTRLRIRVPLGQPKRSA